MPSTIADSSLAFHDWFYSSNLHINPKTLTPLPRLLPKLSPLMLERNVACIHRRRWSPAIFECTPAVTNEDAHPNVCLQCTNVNLQSRRCPWTSWNKCSSNISEHTNMSSIPCNASCIRLGQSHVEFGWGDCLQLCV